MLDAPELVHVQTLVADPVVERLGEAVLSWPSRFNVVRGGPWSSSHSFSSKAMSSGSLSLPIVACVPRVANSLASTPLTEDAVIDLASTSGVLSLEFLEAIGPRHSHLAAPTRPAVERHLTDAVQGTDISGSHVTWDGLTHIVDDL